MRPRTIAETQRGPNRGGMAGEYRLDAQVGYMLRQANQRHTTLFASAMIENLTPTQWAALAKLNESGPSPQNLLGRLTAMDAATIKGVIEPLDQAGLHPDQTRSGR
jgi:MarR family transcriptional regulator, lower aerobic nicotinate degradation pathway regulator